MKKAFALSTLLFIAVLVPYQTMAGDGAKPQCAIINFVAAQTGDGTIYINMDGNTTKIATKGIVKINDEETQSAIFGEINKEIEKLLGMGYHLIGTTGSFGGGFGGNSTMISYTLIKE